MKADRMPLLPAASGQCGETTARPQGRRGASVRLADAATVRDGIRLQRVELLNWGTFHQRIAVLEVGGGNCLLTGQVGAGKSTMVDAISILLNPPSKVTFNQAAGATRRERTLTSYVLGAYRNVSDESTGIAKPDYLRRAAGTQSVILAVFSEAAGGRTVTAGVMLRFQNEATTPKQQYLVADRDLTIADNFTGHPDSRTLRGALKASGVEIFDDYHRYAKALARKLRLSRVALGLFNQAVSMKSVGNLTEFVRTHMLETPDVTTTVDRMLAHYADLTRAHDLVVDTRRQRDALSRVADESKRLDTAEERIAAAAAALSAVPVVVDAHHRDLLEVAITADAAALPALAARSDSLAEQVNAVRSQQTDLRVQLHSTGGSDLAIAERDVEDAGKRVTEVAAARRQLESLAGDAGILPPAGTADFARYLASLGATSKQLPLELEQHQRAIGESVARLTKAKRALEEHDQEMAAAATRSSNIPTPLSGLRDRITTELGLPAGALQFAGELLAVGREHAAWRGAIERLTRGFAMCLLVPVDHHDAVTAWVEQEHLGQKLVMYRIREQASRPPGAVQGSVAAKLVVKPGQHGSAWLCAEIMRRFDHRCVLDATALAHHDRAVTLAGQIKDNARQEKDDRHRIDDRLRWVLGWDTRDRRAALEAARPALRKAVEAAEQELDQRQEQGRALHARDRARSTLSSQFTDAARVDLAAARAAQQAATEHMEALRRNPEIAELTARLGHLEARLTELDSEVRTVAGEKASVEKSLQENRTTLAELEVSEIHITEQAQKVLDRAREEAGAPPVSLSRVDRWERDLRAKVEGHATSARLNRSQVEQALMNAIAAYVNGWPARVVDVDTTSVAGRTELLSIRDRLIKDDLPRFEKNFRDKLQSNAINEIAIFARGLDTDASDITERIATINAALADIEYQEGTRIELTVEPAKDQQVRDFRAELKAITTGMVGGGDGSYNEAKFLAVRELLDRLRGREGHTEEDQRWMRRVTDVRNWHTFAATERSRDEDTLVEHYSDSDGKSGGQKEKLAYTILAASLAYQYGLAEGDTRGFRFVMIDEAFGRGSDESTKYGLDLFGRLRLQLLVVTPLQKISTIEPYVQSVGYIGKTGNASRLRSMTVAEYRELRAQRLSTLPAILAGAAGGP